MKKGADGAETPSPKRGDPKPERNGEVSSQAGRGWGGCGKGGQKRKKKETQGPT